jgi:hypothetical protein
MKLFGWTSSSLSIESERTVRLFSERSEIGSYFRPEFSEDQSWVAATIIASMLPGGARHARQHYASAAMGLIQRSQSDNRKTGVKVNYFPANASIKNSCAKLAAPSPSLAT